MSDRDRDTLPTYADLSRTDGWRTGAEDHPVSPVADTAELAAYDLRYTERALLGSGGMGKVMLSHDVRIGRDVAVKEMHDEKAMHRETRERFLREARVQGQLEHPSIVPVYDIDQRADGTTYFTMRRVLGHTLQEVLEDLRSDAPAAVARYTRRELLTAFTTICLAVEYAHSRGVIHRDLKPANIMLGDFGEVYVLDWGIAHLPHETADVPASRLSMPGELLGTPMYMAPEQMVDSTVRPVADVYSLGAMLFEILTLERLRDPRAVFAPADARPSVRAPHREIPPELETICVRATDEDPAQRYPSARALHQALTTFLDGDRDRLQRRAMAIGHAAAARGALELAAVATSYDREDQERRAALRELARAVALDPENVDYTTTLTTTLATPPREVPREVQAELEEETRRIVRDGAKFSFIGMASWFIYVPLFFLLGVRDTQQLAMMLAAAGAALLISFIAWRQSDVGRPMQLAVMGSTVVAAVFLGRLYGPLVLTPTLLINYVVMVQSHPWRRFRRVGFIFGVLAAFTPALLEMAGVLPSSYSFELGRMIIEPLAVELPRTGTLLFLMLAHLGVLVFPCLFISKLRSDMSALQSRQLVQAWHFRQLGQGLLQPA